MNQFVVILAIAATGLAGCSKDPSAPAIDAIPTLPSDIGDAAELCYFSQAKALANKGWDAVTAAEALGPISYFVTVAVKARSSGVPSLDSYANFTNDKALSDKYNPMQNLPENLEQCFKRFPLAKIDSIASLPEEKPVRTATCLYVAQFAPGIAEGLNENLKTDPIVMKAKSLKTTIVANTADINDLVSKYNVRTSEDDDRLREKTISSSTDFGNFYSIISECK